MGLNARFSIVATDRSGPATASAIRNMRRLMGSVVGSSQQIEHHTNRITSVFQRFGRFVGQQLTGLVRSFFYGLRMGVVGAGVAVSAFVATSLKSFTDFDKKLRETTALIAGASTGGKASNLAGAFKQAQKNYKDFYSYLLATAPKMRRTPQEMAGGLYELVQAGLSGPQAKRLLKPAAMGATAGGGTVEQSSRVLVQIMNALRMGTKSSKSGKTAQGVMDQIFQAINLGVGVDFPGMTQSIGKFIGSAGVTFTKGKGGPKQGMKTLQELMATYVFATQQGARTQDVGVGIQDVIKTIANPSVKSGKFAKSIGLGKLGSGFLQEHGFIGGLTTIIQKMKDAGYTGAKLNDAIGKLFADVRGRRIVAYATNLKMVNDALHSQKQAAYATSAAFKEQGKSMQATIDTFKSYWQVFKIRTGHSLAPIASAGINAITGVLEGAGVTGRGQEILDKAQGMSPSHRKRYLSGLGAEDQYSLGQARKFNKSGLTGQMKMVGTQALTNFQAWWRAPATQQRFQALLQETIQKAFDMAGRAIRQLPSIYGFGRKMAAEILRGVIDGLKANVGSVLSSVTGGLFGGGKGGGGSVLPKASNPYEAAIGGLGGLMAVRGGFGRGPLGRGAGLTAGLMMAGAPAPLAAIAGLLGAGSSLRGKGGIRGIMGGVTGTGAGAAATDMMMHANVVNLTADRVVTGGTGGTGGTGRRRRIRGIAGAGGPAIVPGPAVFPNSDVTYASSIKGQQPYTRQVLPGGFGGYIKPGEAFPKAGQPGFMGPMTEDQWRKSSKIWDRMTVKARTYRRALSNIYQENKRAAGMAGGVGAVALGASQGFTGNGFDWKQGLAGAATGLGGALTIAGQPEFGIPLMIGGSLASSFLGSMKPDKAHGESIFDQIMRPKGVGARGNKPLSPMESKMLALGNVGGIKSIPKDLGLGGKVGAGGGVNEDLLNKMNFFKFKDPNLRVMFSHEFNAAMKTPWNKFGTFSKHMEMAARYAYGNQDAYDALSALDAQWQKNAIANQAREDHNRMINHFDDPKAVEDAKKQAKRLAKGKAPLDFTFGNTHGTFDPRGGSNRPAPGHFTGHLKRGGHYLDHVWDDLQSPATKKITDKAGKTLDKAGKDPITSRTSPSFAHGLDDALRQAKSDAPKKMHDLFKSYTDAAIALAGGSGGGSGPSSGAPPGGGAHHNRGAGAAANTVDTAAAAGAEGSTFGAAMMTAGGAMADKVSDTIANSVAKKQVEGPLGNAMKGLAWLRQQVGKPYIWGGGHPPNPNLKGYDCSGLASSALQVMGSKLAGTTYTMLPNTAPGAGMVTLGFNDPKHPSHMGIGIMGQWYEARGHATPILGPGQARTQWPYKGTPKFHHGGVYDSRTTRGEGPAILKDGEMVVRGTSEGGLKAHPVVAGGQGVFINGPLIGHAEIRNSHDVHHLAQELADLLEKKRSNSITAGTGR